ncbi:MAG: hypothetical protein HC851_06410 [Acaryochloris sp. RU_4_1]|nr:hypothetical protein [Acaryochloris sp. SU_5_25]NJM65318.1 hypothetical protein [Acaryochloris sp. RU_4_1]NJR54676.1 hypothetical protein [Acaryochloris sp. CRU_2_0]
MSEKSAMNCSTLFAELTPKEAELIQGGSLVPTNKSGSFLPNINVSPTINVDASPQTNVIIGIGGSAVNVGQQNNSGGGDNIVSGGPGVVFR